MIKTFLTGRLTRNAEIKEFDSKKVMSYAVAVDTGTKDKPSTLFVDCSQWGEKTGVAPYLLKGTLVAITGEPGIRLYAKNDGTPGGSFTMRVDKVELLGSKAVNTQTTGSGQTERTTPSDISELDSDLPF